MSPFFLMSFCLFLPFLKFVFFLSVSIHIFSLFCALILAQMKWLHVHQELVFLKKYWNFIHNFWIKNLPFMFVFVCFCPFLWFSSVFFYLISIYFFHICPFFVHLCALLLAHMGWIHERQHLGFCNNIYIFI